jgi:predicted dehydrogenase
MNVILIGIGYWGKNIARVLKAEKDINLYAIIDSNDEMEQYAKNLYPETVFTNSYQSFLMDPNVDAAIVATPANTHKKIVIDLINAGKHVLCEKPLGGSIAEFNSIAKMAKDKNVALMVGYTFLYNNIVKYTKQLLENKERGKLLYATFKRTGLGPVRTDTDVISDLAVHDFSICLFWFGTPEWVQKVPSGETNLSSLGSEVAFIQLGYSNGFIVNIHVSWASPIKQRVVEIVTDKEMIIFDDVSTSEKLRIIKREKKTFDAGGDFGRFQLSVKDGDINIPNISYPEPLAEEIKAFIRYTKEPDNDENIRIAEGVSQILESLSK